MTQAKDTPKPRGRLRLRRKPGGQIVIEVPGRDDDIVITVEEIRRGSVTLGVEAALDVGIFREELYEDEGDTP